jgi:thioesterase domain-containing protein
MARTVAGKAGGFAAYEVRSRLRNWRDRAAVLGLRVCLDRHWALPDWVRALDVRSVYGVAEAEYRPRRSLREEIVLFRASEGQGAEEPYIRLYEDPLLGWGKRSRIGVRAFDVPGGHGTMLSEPHVAAIAEILRSLLASVGAEPVLASSGGKAA